MASLIDPFEPLAPVAVGFCELVVAGVPVVEERASVALTTDEVAGMEAVVAPSSTVK